MEGYEILSKLGEGGFASIETVQNKSSGTEYAAKFASYVNAIETNAEFHILRLFAELFPTDSPAVELFDSFNYENSRVLIMQKYRYDFRGLEKAHVFDKITLKEFIFVVFSMSKSISEMHSIGVVHNDLKSANILLDDTGKSRIADFGLARVELGHYAKFDTIESAVASLEECVEPEHTGTICTLLYRSPEQLFSIYRENGKKIEEDMHCSAKKQDLYSQGIIIFEIILNHFFTILQDRDEEKCELELKKLYLEIYGSKILEMARETYKNVDPEEYILQEFELDEREEIENLLREQPIDIVRVLRTLLLLRFEVQCFSEIQKYLDDFSVNVSNLLSCVPSERHQIIMCNIFKQDCENIISALPSNALDGTTEICLEKSLYVEKLEELNYEIDFSSKFRNILLQLEQSGITKIGCKEFKEWSSFNEFYLYLNGVKKMK